MPIVNIIKYTNQYSNPFFKFHSIIDNSILNFILILLLSMNVSCCIIKMNLHTNYAADFREIIIRIMHMYSKLSELSLEIHLNV